MKAKRISRRDSKDAWTIRRGVRHRLNVRTMIPWRRDFRSSKQAAAPSRSRRRRADSTSAMGGVMSKPIGWTIGIAVALVAIPIAWVTTAGAQNVRHYRFAYDQPRSTGYGVAADIFSNKLAEL